MLSTCLILLSLIAVQTPPDIAQLAWLKGSWGGTAQGTESEEHWTSAKAGSMVGMHRDVSRGRTVGFEFIRIEARPDGIFYLASPNGRNPPTPFKMVESAGQRVVFENKEHDFPQRITYWMQNGELHARVEGPQGGRTVAMEWAWKRLAN